MVAFITAVLKPTGGADSPLLNLYLLPIIVSALTLGKWVTLLTAFGIAIVKACMVVMNFMHIGATRRFVPYLVVTCLLFMLLFFAGVAPDVMKAHGENWSKPSWLEAQAQAAVEGGHSH